MSADNANAVTREKLVEDMRAVIADAEELLRASTFRTASIVRR